MSDKPYENELPEDLMGFSKFMAETIKREEAKKAIVLPVETGKTDPKEPYNPNKEYQKRYSHRATDRMWIGKRRYQ